MNTQSKATNVKAGKHLRNPFPTTKTAIPPAGATIHHTMVAEAAYYAAERRGFVPGSELEDWLAAEREIEATLAGRI